MVLLDKIHWAFRRCVRYLYDATCVFNRRHSNRTVSEWSQCQRLQSLDLKPPRPPRPPENINIIVFF